jgi:hypothetical protein
VRKASIAHTDPSSVSAQPKRKRDGHVRYDALSADANAINKCEPLAKSIVLLRPALLGPRETQLGAIPGVVSDDERFRRPYGAPTLGVLLVCAAPIAHYRAAAVCNLMRSPPKGAIYIANFARSAGLRAIVQPSSRVRCGLTSSTDCPLLLYRMYFF